ncbi:hypothetical protein STCU_11414 [Strigomonas culicis]|uniref:Uncharacterized protein n=1 Tax=Strigomonas culicis TaxID=28005 RepID=S9UNR2_9TRYP|nr:hypothetical protein STCU_11414 [Strigomonas culicis]|eukprot:EPY16316.1 hypothetical protein STCU_11414 [Strigomonas culicis]
MSTPHNFACTTFNDAALPSETNGNVWIPSPNSRKGMAAKRPSAEYNAPRSGPRNNTNYPDSRLRANLNPGAGNRLMNSSENINGVRNNPYVGNTAVPPSRGAPPAGALADSSTSPLQVVQMRPSAEAANHLLTSNPEDTSQIASLFPTFDGGDADDAEHMSGAALTASDESYGQGRQMPPSSSMTGPPPLPRNNVSMTQVPPTNNYAGAGAASRSASTVLTRSQNLTTHQPYAASHLRHPRLRQRRRRAAPYEHE